MKHLIKFICTVLGFCIAFYLYGTGRTMTEHVGFTWHGMCSGIILTLIPISIILLGTLIIFKYTSNAFRAPIFTISLSVMVGILISESTLLIDEINFMKEVEAAYRNTQHEKLSRPRTWPHSTGALLWAKERGVWSTD